MGDTASAVTNSPHDDDDVIRYSFVYDTIEGDETSLFFIFRMHFRAKNRTYLSAKFRTIMCSKCYVDLIVFVLLI